MKKKSLLWYCDNLLDKNKEELKKSMNNCYLTHRQRCPKLLVDCIFLGGHGSFLFKFYEQMLHYVLCKVCFFYVEVQTVDVYAYL